MVILFHRYSFLDAFFPGSFHEYIRHEVTRQLELGRQGLQTPMLVTRLSSLAPQKTAAARVTGTRKIVAVRGRSRRVELAPASLKQLPTLKTGLTSKRTLSGRR